MKGPTPRFRRSVTRALARAGVKVQRLGDEDRRYLAHSYDPTTPLPADAHEVLRPDHPRLVELRGRYAALDLPVTEHTVWRADRSGGELSWPYFRGDNAYVWQYRHLRAQARLKQYLVLRHAQDRDHRGMLDLTREDGAFGAWTFRYGSRPPVSRDLLDSVLELSLLDRELSVATTPQLRVVDVGAGYGRLAHRACEALPDLAAYDCLDAVPESTYLCAYYLQHRGVDDRARSVPLDQLDQLEGPYDLAVNVHSFSECSRAAIRWWVDWLDAHAVPWLFVVPNEPVGVLSNEANGARIDVEDDLRQAGYTLHSSGHVLDDEEIRELTGIQDVYRLYRSDRHRGRLTPRTEPGRTSAP